MTAANPLPYRLDRTLTIQADPAVVFSFFEVPARWAAWWGPGSTIDPRPGGRVRIVYPGGVEVSGDVIEIAASSRIVFTYGYASGTPIPAGASRVTIQLESVGGATRLHLTHEFGDPAVRDQHMQGWRYQLSLFANAVADRLHGGAANLVDRWFEAWGEADAARRDTALAALVEPGVRFADRFSAIDGLAELSTHLDAARRFMPGLRMRRDGDVRHCQGTVLAHWIATNADGQERARGTSVFVLDAHGKFVSVTGFWD